MIPSDAHLQTALSEIGPIDPWFSEEDNLYVFEHPAYPWVMHAGLSIEETKEGYLRALTGFLEERAAGTVAPAIDQTTPGRGGARPGAGRPRKPARTRIYLDQDLALWLKDEQNQALVRQWMQQAG